MARVPLGGVGVHAEAGTGVDLDDPATLLAHGAGDVSGDEVDAGHVESDDHRRLTGDLDIIGVDIVGAVDRGTAGAHIAGQLELDEAAILRHVVQDQPLLRQHLDGLRIDGDPGQDLLVPDAATRISIGDLDQLGDGVRAVADDVGRHPLGNGDHLIVDDQDAVVLTGDERLHHNQAVTAFALRGREGLVHGGFIGKIDHHATAMIAVERLQHHRVPNRRATSAASSAERTTSARGTGIPISCSRRLVSSLLPATSTEMSGCGAGDGGPDALLVGPVAELDERAAWVEAQHRDTAPLRLGNDGAGGGTEREPLRQPDDVLFQLANEVEVRLGVVDDVVEEARGQLAGGDTDIFLGIGVDDVVEPALTRAARLAPGDLGSGQVLQLQCHVLEDVPHPGSLAHALQEPTRFANRAAVLVETGQELGEVLVEPGDLVGRPLLELADIDFHEDGRHAGPDVGSTEDGGAANLDRHLRLLGFSPTRFHDSFGSRRRSIMSKRLPALSTCRIAPLTVIAPCPLTR